MNKSVVGIIAHVDAGKTTLAEALLYKTGKLRKQGRVDNGDTHLDTHEIERQRGITIFAGQSVFTLGDTEITLLDTPGHVDFSAETERILHVLDYALLVISGTDGVQAHTITLWKLLQIYNIPTFIFVTKMDFARYPKAEIMKGLKKELSDNCIDMSEDNEDRYEELALCSEEAMEQFLNANAVDLKTVANLVFSRSAFPVYFGSGLKSEGIDYLLASLESLIIPKNYPDSFGARVFKITHDENGNRITHLKITGGGLRVKETFEYNGKSEKINEIRMYSGAKFTPADYAEKGSVCAVTGLTEAQSGMGLGYEKDSSQPILEPVMIYRLILPKDVDAKTFMPKLRLLEEEDPQLHILWNQRSQEISVSLMGQIQVEILKSIILSRFNVEVDIADGKVQYKETISDRVEGVGHYEPLRHYSEVHLILSPLPSGSGIKFNTTCNEDLLDRNWQRLILTNLAEKTHIGVLIGAPITDMKITLASGKAHIKHTEGGDFRQATYRAVRQGLMQAKSRLLEPYYEFTIHLPTEYIGRAISDIKMLYGEFEPPTEENGISILKGKAPVSTMNTYASTLAAYTSGRGRIRLTVCGYFDCHNEAQIIEEHNYNPEADLDNSPDSVFCAHGSGFPVKWNEVKNYMHLESALKTDSQPISAPKRVHIEDKELEAIMEKEFGPAKTTQTLYRYTPQTQSEKDMEFDSSVMDKYVIVDGYNCIFAWDSLKTLIDDNMPLARKTLADTLSNYAAYTRSNIVLVYDGYRRPEGEAERILYHNIHIVYTKEKETADAYIEKLVTQIGKNHNVRVVTSDGMIQLTAVKSGVVRIPSKAFEEEIESVKSEITEFIKSLN